VGFEPTLAPKKGNLALEDEPMMSNNTVVRGRLRLAALYDCGTLCVVIQKQYVRVFPRGQPHLKPIHESLSGSLFRLLDAPQFHDSLASLGLNGLELRVFADDRVEAAGRESPGCFQRGRQLGIWASISTRGKWFVGYSLFQADSIGA